MIDFRQKLWTKLYYKTRLSNSREISKRAAKEAVEDFDNMFEEDELHDGDDLTTEKQVLDAIFKRLKESTIGSEKKITWCKYGAELDFEFDSKGAVKSIN